MKLPRIESLDLRPLSVIVAEHNALHPGFQLRVWDPREFHRSVDEARRRQGIWDMDAFRETARQQRLR